MKNVLYNNFLEQIFIDFTYENHELKICHCKCPIYNLFCGVTAYLFDFPEGIVKVNGELSEKIDIGVWSDAIDDASYIITREEFGKYSFDCKEEDLRNLKKGTILIQKEKFVLIETLQDLATQIKNVIIDYLMINERQDILADLEKHYCWKLIKPTTAKEYKEFKKNNLW